MEYHSITVSNVHKAIDICLLKLFAICIAIGAHLETLGIWQHKAIENLDLEQWNGMGQQVDILKKPNIDFNPQLKTKITFFGGGYGCTKQE